MNWSGECGQQITYTIQYKSDAVIDAITKRIMPHLRQQPLFAQWSTENNVKNSHRNWASRTELPHNSGNISNKRKLAGEFVCAYFFFLFVLSIFGKCHTIARSFVQSFTALSKGICFAYVHYFIIYSVVSAINAFLLFTYVQIFHSMLLSRSISLVLDAHALAFFALLSLLLLLGIDKSNMFSLTLVCSVRIHHMFKWKKKKYVWVCVCWNLCPNTHKKVAHALGNRMTVRTVK